MFTQVICVAFIYTFIWMTNHVEAVSKVALENNGYKNLVIAINPSVPENPELIEVIKELVTEASTILYTATRQRSYFNDVTILVPKVWTSGTYDQATLESYSEADIVIADPNRSFGNSPYTLQYGGCGEPGEYIHLTPEYLTSTSSKANYGDKGKVLVHEWAHYRWGVFDEIQTPGYDAFYLTSSGVQPNKCPASLRGFFKEVDYEKGKVKECEYDEGTRLPTKDCQFIPFGRQDDELDSSIMSLQFLDQVVTFCHSDPSDPLNMHNSAAPNEHNRLCNLRSTWDVIMDSKDFKDGANPSNPDVTDINPTFKVVRAPPPRYVLVMDVSGSMAGARLEIMRTAALLFIADFAPAGSYIGLVSFSTNAVTLSELQLVQGNDDPERQNLKTKIPAMTEASTGIGGGILKGIEVLENGPFIANGGNLLVLSDGIETIDPMVADVYNEVISKEVRIDSIFFDLTDNANSLMTNLSEASGGQWFIAKSTDPGQLIDVFQALSSADDGADGAQSIQIHSNAISIDNSAEYEGEVLIDSTIGNGTVFAFAWITYDSLKVILETPQTKCMYSNYFTADMVLCPNNPIHSSEAGYKLLKFNIPGAAETGKWKYTISTNFQSFEDISITVTSSAADPNVLPVKVESNILITDIQANTPAVVYSKVVQGYAPVLYATVIAFISTPSNDVIQKTLRDNGAGFDVRANDGVYSSSFTEFSGQGRYSVQVKVTKSSSASSLSYSSSRAAFNFGTAFENGTVIVNPNGAEAPSNNIGNVTSTATDFERVTTGSSFSYEGPAVTDDTFKPNQVIDLQVRQMNLQDPDAGIIVRFTAPGDDFDTGNASRYDIRYTLGNSNELLTNFDTNKAITTENVIQGNLNSPNPSSTVEEIVVTTPNLPNDTDTVRVSFAIRAFDDADNPSDVSNVAATTFFIVAAALPTNPPPEPDTTVLDTTEATTKKVSPTNPPPEPDTTVVDTTTVASTKKVSSVHTTMSEPHTTTSERHTTTPMKTTSIKPSSTTLSKQATPGTDSSVPTKQSTAATTQTSKEEDINENQGSSMVAFQVLMGIFAFTTVVLGGVLLWLVVLKPPIAKIAPEANGIDASNA